MKSYTMSFKQTVAKLAEENSINSASLTFNVYRKRIGECLNNIILILIQQKFFLLFVLLILGKLMGGTMGLCEWLKFVMNPWLNLFLKFFNFR